VTACRCRDLPMRQCECTAAPPSCAEWEFEKLLLQPELLPLVSDRLIAMVSASRPSRAMDEGASVAAALAQVAGLTDCSRWAVFGHWRHVLGSQPKGPWFSALHP